MALFSTHNVSIKGISACVPKLEYDNMDYKWIPVKERVLMIKTVGVEKRIVEKGVITSDLCFHAAEKLLKMFNGKKKKLNYLSLLRRPEIIIFLLLVLYFRTGSVFQKNVMTFDVGLGCSGYVYGLEYRRWIIKFIQIKKGTVVGWGRLLPKCII